MCWEGSLVVSALEGSPFIGSCKVLNLCLGWGGCLLVVLLKMLLC